MRLKICVGINFPLNQTKEKKIKLYEDCLFFLWMNNHGDAIPNDVQGLLMLCVQKLCLAGSGDHMGCQGVNSGELHARQVSYGLYYLSGP